jgi:predicted phage tail protein
MGSEQILLWLGLGIVLPGVAILVVLTIINERRRREQTEQLRREVETLKQTVGALCSSAVGVDRRVNRLERQGRDLEERQESIESGQHHTDRPYADAIRRVKEGADADQLVQELGISHGAADLLIMMHGLNRDEQLAE